MNQNSLKEIERNANSLLERVGIKLRPIKAKTTVSLGDRTYVLPAHNEQDWFKEYIRDCIEERGMDAENLENLSREAYALLRYKQALSGSSDGSQLGAFLAITGHVQGDHAKEVYRSALNEYDSRLMSSASARRN